MKGQNGDLMFGILYCVSVMIKYEFTFTFGQTTSLLHGGNFIPAMIIGFAGPGATWNYRDKSP